MTTSETKRQCPQCERLVNMAEVICPFCGHLFVDHPVATTRGLEAEDTDEIRSSRWGNSRVGSKMKLVLRLVHSGVEFSFDPLNVEQITMGRADPATSELPTIDLGRHEGEAFGVSRKHIQIRRTQNNALTVQDQGSANGTYLNGQRLIPLQPRILRDGDELRVARMVVHVAFVPDTP